MENDLSQNGIFAGFSLCIVNFAGRISEAAIGGRGAFAGQCPISSVKEPKKTGA